MKIELANGEVVELYKEDFINLITNDANGSYGNIRRLHKLSVEKHVLVEGQMRQRVRPAIQLLSGSTANCFALFGEEGKAEVIKCINNGFDVLNSHTMYNSNNLKCALGIHENVQLEALKSFLDLLMRMEWKNQETGLFSSTKKPSQKGNSSINLEKILISSSGMIACIKSVLSLYQELKDEGWKFFLTARVNQDFLENFFRYSSNSVFGKQVLWPINLAFAKQPMTQIVQHTEVSFYFQCG